ncbi:MAG: hypothetical protein Q9170_005341 [Blastenia crenularia]
MDSQAQIKYEASYDDDRTIKLDQSEGMVLAQGADMVLLPQPSTDPNDPLNWRPSKKMTILLVISMTAFLPDFGSSMGAVTSVVQSNLLPGGQWDIPQTTVNHSLVGNLFMLGAGGIFVIILSTYFGRAPVLFWFVTMSVCTAAWCGAATNFESFMAARIVNGFFSTVTQSGGLMFINDMFFFHEHPRKINIWSGFIILSPYLGPFSTSFIVWKSTWRWAFYLLTMVSALCWLLILAVADETYYNRQIPMDQQPKRRSRLLRLVGIEQWSSRHQRPSFGQALLRPFLAIVKLPVLLAVAYYFFTFAWVVGLNTQISVFLTNPELYDFNDKDVGLFYFAPIVATVLAEIVGHWIHDWAGAFYARRNGGKFEPEGRLLPIYMASPLMIAGIVLVGVGLQRVWHYMAIAVSMGLFVFGIMIVTTAINAYVLDSYPEAPGEVSAWVNFGRTVGGFIVTYYEIKWAKAEGTQKSLGIQAAVVAAAVLDGVTTAIDIEVLLVEQDVLLSFIPLLLHLTSAQNTSTCPAPTGFGNTIVVATLPSFPTLKVNDAFASSNILFRYIDPNVLLSQAVFSTFCLDQCISYQPDPNAGPMPMSGTQPLVYVSNRTGPCLSFTVNMGKPIPPDPNDNAARWFCAGFSKYFAENQSDFVPADAPGSFMYSLGVNRACNDSYRFF